MRSQRQALPTAPDRTHRTCSRTGRDRHRKATEGPHPIPSPAFKHSNTAITEPTAARKTRPRSPTLDAAHDVIRELGLRGSGGDLLPENTDTDSDLEMVQEAPAGSVPAGPAPPAGSVRALCPASKQGHCTGKG